MRWHARNGHARAARLRSLAAFSRPARERPVRWPPTAPWGPHPSAPGWPGKCGEKLPCILDEIGGKIAPYSGYVNLVPANILSNPV